MIIHDRPPTIQSLQDISTKLFYSDITKDSLVKRKYKLSRYGKRYFSVVATYICNELTVPLITNVNYLSFKSNVLLLIHKNVFNFPLFSTDKYYFCIFFIFIFYYIIENV